MAFLQAIYGYCREDCGFPANRFNRTDMSVLTETHTHTQPDGRMGVGAAGHSHGTATQSDAFLTSAGLQTTLGFSACWSDMLPSKGFLLSFLSKSSKLERFFWST